MQRNYKRIRDILLYVLVLNILVVIGKMTVGIISNSLSMIADSLHSLFDASSNIIGLIGLWIAQKKPDAGHPYGHSKYNSLATIFIAFLLLLTSIQVFQGAVDKFLNPTVPELTIYNWIIMVATIGVNIGVSRFEKQQGLKLKSSILVADAAHTSTDIYLSLSVIVSFILVSLGYPVFDPVISVLIAVVIFYVGFSIINGISKVLTDSLVIEPKYIEKVVYGVKGVRNVHKIRSHGTISECFIDLHITVDDKLNVKDAHDVSVEVEANLKREFPNIKEVMVHVEPHK